MPDDTKPLHARVRMHIVRGANVCTGWCRTWRLYDRILPTAFLFGVLCFLVYYITVAPPINFPGGSLMKVGKTETIDDVAQRLKERRIINSPLVFTLAARVYGADEKLFAGEYFFPGPQSVFTVARRLARGDFQLVPVKVTIPEGINTYQMADILARKLPDFDKEGFVAAAQPKEGYLFPDTYFFLPGQDPLLVIETMELNFKRKVNDPAVASAIAAYGKPLSDIVIMASLLEKEANDMESKKLISGILWRRLAIGMPLQVDAVFPYIIGKNSLQLTRTDLKTESPYNTYVNKGLPPGPITNPGIDSILAAVTPVKSQYVFYLSDLDGKFHYSVTYAQHLVYQKRYLK